MLSVRWSLSAGSYKLLQMLMLTSCCNNSVSALFESFKRLQLKFTFVISSLFYDVVRQNVHSELKQSLFSVDHECSKGSNNGSREVLQWKQSQYYILLHYSGLDLSLVLGLYPVSDLFELKWLATLDFTPPLLYHWLLSNCSKASGPVCF